MINSKKIALALSGSVAALGLFIVSAVKTHAAAFSVSTSTLNSDSGSMLQDVYNYVVGLLTTGGAFQFLIVITLIGGIVVLAVWGINKLFKGGRRI